MPKFDTLPSLIKYKDYFVSRCHDDQELFSSLTSFDRVLTIILEFKGSGFVVMFNYFIYYLFAIKKLFFPYLSCRDHAGVRKVLLRHAIRYVSFYYDHILFPLSRISMKDMLTCYNNECMLYHLSKTFAPHGSITRVLSSALSLTKNALYENYLGVDYITISYVKCVIQVQSIACSDNFALGLRTGTRVLNSLNFKIHDGDTSIFKTVKDDVSMRTASYYFHNLTNEIHVDSVLFSFNVLISCNCCFGWAAVSPDLTFYNDKFFIIAVDLFGIKHNWTHDSYLDEHIECPSCCAFSDSGSEFDHHVDEISVDFLAIIIDFYRGKKTKFSSSFKVNAYIDIDVFDSLSQKDIEFFFDYVHLPLAIDKSLLDVDVADWMYDTNCYSFLIISR
jgi:hypothetical protein